MPLNPVVTGHIIAISTVHVDDALTAPWVTGHVFEDAARYAGYNYDYCNFITSVGAPATQTIKHLHVHIVPRSERDGLKLPWTEQHENSMPGETSTPMPNSRLPNR